MPEEIKNLTGDEIDTVVTEWYQDHEAVSEQMMSWLETGRTVAFYRNQDLGHPDVGAPRILTCNHPEAQFEGDPPKQLPDFPGEINWRFQLWGIYTPQQYVADGGIMDPPDGDEDGESDAHS